MNKNYSIIILLLLVVLLTIPKNKTIEESTPETLTLIELKEKHKNLLENYPYNETRFLTKKERKELGIPPNGFNEQEWIRTMDPNLGYPNYQGALKIQRELNEARNATDLAPRVPGDASDNSWVEQGPNNIGGRTRGILFDPNDANNERVFAGGVSGGLWVNNDITDPASPWTLVPEVPENIAVNEIIVDPNDSNTLYIASGESYTSGPAIGNGVYRSTDGGVNWIQIFGGPDGTNATVLGGGVAVALNGIFYINDIIARSVGVSPNETTELYISAASGSDIALSGSSTPLALPGLFQRGVYRSLDDGATWTLIPLATRPFDDDGDPITPDVSLTLNPNDLELDITNNIWVTSTTDDIGTPGGDIYMSSDGVTFTLVASVTGVNRTELEPSQQDADVFYLAFDAGGQAALAVTNDAFNTNLDILSEPNDADVTVGATDYTRGQAFYDLPIEVDPTDDTILYIGGINLFRGPITVDNVTGARSIATNDWEQISIEGTAFGPTPALPVSTVHADQHAIVFRPGNSNQAVFGTDGGIYFGSNLASSSNSTTAITPRNNGYNVTQFYAGDINDVDGTMGGGTQDNGTPFNIAASVNTDPFFSTIGGDGAYGQFDDDGDYFIATTQFINYFFINTPITGSTNSFNLANAMPTIDITGYNITDIPDGPDPDTFPDDRPGGNFINEADVDTNLDILYINATNLGVTQIGRYADLETGPPATETTLTDPLLTGVISALRVSPFETTASRLLVGTEQGVLLNAENAQSIPTWTNISDTNFLGSISDIEFGQNENIIMVTFSNFGVDSVFYTDDGGSSWVSKEGDLPDIPVFTILQNPLNLDEAIVGTQFGVFRTENFLATDPNWVQSFNGMSNVPVRDLDLRPSTNEVLATTHGRGMFTGQFLGGTLSIEDNIVSNDEIILFPTVSNGNFSLRTQRNFDDLNMEIYSITGSKIFESEVNFINSQSDFSLNLQSGLYLVRISDGVFNETKKMIIE